ncbi:hypothetical protein CHELA20_10137 [Hyphomicrobiales bacterium]|nr:hypothetical protein CHELA20_10137 [Hyphomicrobiales bacterium]CAH1690690.1 hypothetical protein CHELA41_50365 [Hyphomicrobiales bacterium]
MPRHFRPRKRELGRSPVVFADIRFFIVQNWRHLGKAVPEHRLSAEEPSCRRRSSTTCCKR